MICKTSAYTCSQYKVKIKATQINNERSERKGVRRAKFILHLYYLFLITPSTRRLLSRSTPYQR